MLSECQLIELELKAPTDSFSISGSPNTGITSKSLLTLATSSTITKFLSPLNVNITLSPVSVSIVSLLLKCVFDGIYKGYIILSSVAFVCSSQFSPSHVF